MTELLALLVLVPIVAAVVPLVATRIHENAGWPIALLVTLVQLVLAAELTRQVLATGALSYAVGGIPAPFGIELVVDGLSVLVLDLVAVVALGLLAYTRRSGPQSGTFYSLYLLLLAGLAGLCVTADVFNLYVFLEISGLAAYALVACSPGGEAAIAALKYLLLGTFGASLYLLGIGYTYVLTGTLNMADLATHLGGVGYASTPVVVAFTLIAVGLGIKVALVPLHVWLPDAHSKAPVPVSVLLSGLVTSAAAYALVRLSLSVFTVEFFRQVTLANDALLIAAAASVLYGGASALREIKLKRVLAYSTIAQLGLVVLGIGLLDETALVGAAIHLVGHGLMKGGLFLVAGCFAVGFDATRVSEYAGMAKRAPLVSASFAVLALGMVGIPPTVGFLGKWYIALAAVQTGAWALAALVFVSTLLSLTIFGPILHRMYFEAPGRGGYESSGEHGRSPVAHDGGSTPARGSDAGTPPDGNAEGDISVGMRWITVATAVATLVLGFAAPALTRLLEPVVSQLL